MGYIKEIIERMIRLQHDGLQHETEEYFGEAEGRVAHLRVVGLRGESLLLHVRNGKIEYANSTEKPVHVLRCSEDTFLDLIAGDTNLRECMTKGHFEIENQETGGIDLVEMEKWSHAFSRLGGLVQQIMKMKLRR